MQRRGESEQPVKGRRTNKPKVRKAQAEPVSNADLQEQLDRAMRERDEAREQQTATAEILRVIRASPTDVQPVFDAIVESAARLCEAVFSVVWRYDGDLLHYAASHNFTPEVLDRILKTYPKRPDRSVAAGRAILDGRIAHVPNMLADPEYAHELALAGNWRATLAVPMLRDGKPVGAISVGKAEAMPFSERQIQLLSTFADQAVIAIENVRLFNETKEALEQQTATSEVLKIISSSPGELEPVFNAMLANATRICEARFGNLFLREGPIFRSVAVHSKEQSHVDFWRRNPLFDLRNNPGGPLDRIAKTKQVVHIPDLRTDQSYIGKKNDRMVRLVEVAGARTLLTVPMLKEGELIGAINMYRQDVRPFTDKQIELVQNFAAQAVIAIENARLLNELRQRTGDLTESLEQQTATSEVLRIIAKSPQSVQPVFDAIVSNAARLCEATFSAVAQFDGELLHLVAVNKMSPEETAAYHTVYPRPPNRSFIMGRAFLDGKPAHVEDIEADPDYDPHTLSVLKAAAPYRTYLGIPILRDGIAIGVIGCGRREVKPFTEAQIALVMSFADQAVIAIENTRLLNELRESLQQQTATADVLKVISRSTFDLQMVLSTLVESATRLCEADHAWLFERKGDFFSWVAGYGHATDENARIRDYFIEHPVGVDRGSITGRAVLEGKVVHVADVLADPEYTWGGAQKIGGYRAALGVPLLSKGDVVGVIFVARTAPKPYTEKQIELVTTFGDQAVIAIENTRLLSELRQSLQQQTATADVLKIISRSTFDLQIVLDTLVESAHRLCEADKAFIFYREGETYRWGAGYGLSIEYKGFMQRELPKLEPGRGSISGRVALERATVHIPDVLSDPEFTWLDAQKLGQHRTVLGVPLMQKGALIGMLGLTRNFVQPFSDKQIELATTFADQAVIAIENVRLFESVEARTRELAASLENLRATQDRLVQTEKLASLGQLTAGIAHEIKNPLNFVNNFSAVSVELIDELRGALAGANLNKKLRAEISEIADMLQGNLDKVVQHGKRADAIVKNMLLHSRAGSGEHRPVDINAVVEESLNLAWHGARAEKQGFNITLEKSFDPTAGEADVFPQEVTRALLNLISNGFYAATKRKAEANGGDYEPTLTAATKNLGDRVEIRIRDNGTGIPPEVKHKLFSPFFTTKPAGEGTGLGLSISHDIVVKQHGGSIEVDTQPGEFTEFRIVLPRAAVVLAESGKRG